MSEPGLPRPPARSVAPLESMLTSAPSAESKMPGERCGAEMYRTHAVWRCPSCGLETDCCGW